MTACKARRLDPQGLLSPQTPPLCFPGTAHPPGPSSGHIPKGVGGPSLDKCRPFLHPCANRICLVELTPGLLLRTATRGRGGARCTCTSVSHLVARRAQMEHQWAGPSPGPLGPRSAFCSCCSQTFSFS